MSAPSDERDGGGLFPLLATAVPLLLALVLRLEMGFWQGEGSFRGHQACFFLLSAVQYEKHGIAKTLGYPSPAIDGVPIGDDDVAPLAEDPATLVYVNHPPTVPLFAWAALRVLGHPGWQVFPQPGELLPDPRMSLWWLQVPFLLLHVFGLWAFAWCVRQAFGTRAGLLALALLAVTPVAILQGAGVGYENPSLSFVFLALGFWVRHARGGARRDLVRASVSVALGTCVTWGPLLLVPAIALESALRRRWRLARTALQALGTAALLPLLAHLLLARATGAQHAGAASHALELLQPLFTSPRHWLAVQGETAVAQIGPWILALGLGGLAIVAWRGARSVLRRSGAADAPVCVPIVLLAAAGLQLAAFARHSIQDQPIFQLVLAPGVAACGAMLLDRIAGRGSHVRAALTAALVLGAALPSIRQAREVCAIWGEGLGGYITARPPRVPEHLGWAIADDVPVGSVVIVPDWYRGITLPMSMAAGRSVVALATPQEIERLRERFPAARGRPTFAVVFDDPWDANMRFLRDINDRFLAGLPAGAEGGPGQYHTGVWRLP